MCCLKDCNQIQAYFIKSYDLWKYYKIQYEKGYYIPKKYIKANKWSIILYIGLSIILLLVMWLEIKNY